MEDLILWIQENLGILLTGTTLAAILGFLYHWFATKATPKIITGVINMFAKLVSNLFGVSYGDGKDMVNALPIVNNLKEFESKIVLDAEMKLLELSQKLASPVYTAAEKLPIQQTFDYIYRKFKNQLSPEVLKILETFEKATQE